MQQNRDLNQQQLAQELNHTWNSDDAYRQALRNFAKQGQTDLHTNCLLGEFGSEPETPTTGIK